jgi:MFS transporter, DHA1 family, solute carrier family 18 (vesicular amine transporter), member 1/2
LFTDLAVYDMVVPFMQDFARPWGVGERELGFLFATYVVALLVTIPFAGRLCDRLGAGRALRIGASGLLLSLGLYAIANGQVMLFVARAVQGAAGGMSWTAGLALLAAAFPAERRGRALGVAMAGMSLGTLVGPPIGGWLFDCEPRMPFAIFAGWAATILLLLVLTPLPAGQAAAGSSAPTGRPRLHGYVLTSGIVVIGSMMLSCLEPTLPIDLETRLQITPKVIGVLFSLAALAYGLASPAAGWAADRWGNRRVMSAGIAGCCLTLPLAALPKSWWGEAAALAAFGFTLAFLLAPTLPEIAAACERNGATAFGAAYAVFNLAYAIGMVVGQITGGELAPAIGFGPTLLVFSLIAAAYLPVLLRRADPVATTLPAPVLVRRAG